MRKNVYISASHDVFPQTYIVMQLSKKIKKETANWLLHKIVSKREIGGAELLIRGQPFIKGQRLTFHVSVDKLKLLELAEEMEIRKEDKFGILREFTMKELSEFTHSIDDEHLLTTAEKQVLVNHELENLRALAHDSCVPGYPFISLYEGQSIISALKYNGLVKQMFPLHEEDEVKKFQSDWFMTLSAYQPYESIRLYFGESVALYFQFLGYYTSSLILPMLLGIFQLFLWPETLVFFSIVNVLVATLFLEFWRRKCTELAFIWGTISMTSLDEPRPNFRGVMAPDPITRKMLPHYPRWKTNLKMYCVSLPLVIVCMLGALIVMLLSFTLDDMVRNMEVHSWVIWLPSIVYTGLIEVMNLMYRQFANSLTEWENHRTQSQFERHRVTKIVLFEFINNFVSMFYIAFIKQDMDMLRYQIALQMIILQILNNIQETVVPLLLRYSSSKVKNVSSKFLPDKSKYEQLSEDDLEGFKFLDADDSRVIQASSEAVMDLYEDPYDDYSELFLQFGYVYLFSAVYPMAAFWAVFNNVIEMKSDAYKLCRIYQRPIARRVKDIGAWHRAFRTLCSLAVLTNCSLLYLTPQLRLLSPETSETSWVLSFVILEHLLLGFRQVLHYVIPDKPEWVKLALARSNYLSKQALKMQRMMKSKSTQDLIILED